MPFKSKAQQRFMFAAEARGELPKGKALEWAHETKNIKKLPERKKTAADIAKEIIDRIDICAVDGGQARQQDQSFSVGGHHYVYPFIPENEIWIESGNEGKDLSALIGHEVTERDMMKRQGLTYDQAHPIANHVEEAVRLEEGKQDGDTENEEGTVTNKKTAAANENSPRSTLIEFFNKNHNPDDESFHAFADSKGLNKHKLEAEAYELATGHARFLGDGRAKDKSVTESDVDSGELSKGTEVETEHTPDRTTSKRIALDHLAEIPDYYKRLKKMEDAATSSEKKTASDIAALVAQRIYESEKKAEELKGVARALRLGGDLVEEGADQYMRYRIRKKNEEKYKLQEQHQSLPKVAAGANFPPISGPTSTSGITTSSQHEEKLKRSPPVPKPDAQPLGSWDIDKVSSLIDSLIPKIAGVNPAPVEDPQELYHKAVGADRRHRILTSTISGALSSGITAPILLKQMGLSGGNLAKASLGLTGISALLGAATGGVSGMLGSRRAMKSVYDAEGMKGLHAHIKRHGLAESAFAGGVGGLVGAGTSLLLRDSIPKPWQASKYPALQSLGKAVPPMGEIAGSLGTAMGSSYAVDKIVDAMHGKQGSYYDDFPHNPDGPDGPEVPADRYTSGRQGLLYLSSALHPFMSAPLAAATAHPGERFDQFGRALFGGIAGDVVGGLAGSFALGPKGFLLGSLLGRPAGTYIAQHVD